MSASHGRTNRPYRKASEYLVAANKTPVPDGMQSQLSHENEILNQRLVVLTRKLEHTEAEFNQTKEYLENELKCSRNREVKINEQYRRLQSSYASLQASNREVELRISQVSQVEAEKNLLIREVNELSSKLTEARTALMRMQDENERLRKDCNTAAQLLKCNQTSYQVKRPEQLPEGILDQVNTYKVELQNYHEYINPYADASDSASDDEQAKANHVRNMANFSKSPNQQAGDNVPVEFIAEALKKPENVHLNLEPSDYIQDPSLHSVYKAHYVERKLIRPDYDPKEKSLRSSGLPSRYNAEADQNHRQASTDNSPWELAPSQQGVPRYEPNPDDESPAGAYGAYSVGPKRKPRPRPVNAEPPRRARPVASNNDGGAYYAPRRSPSPEELSFRAPSQPAKTGITSYFAKSAKSSPSVSMSSSSSSKKSTPLKVRGKEAATSAETSSLLNQSESEEDEGVMVEISHSKISSPEKRYKKEKQVGDEGGSLLASAEDPGTLPPPPSAVELEWDPEIDLDDTIVEIGSQEVDDLAKEAGNLKVETTAAHPDLLLSYNNVETKKTNDLEELISSPEHESLQLPPPNASGQLLSEIVINNPSLSNFLLTSAPPPPQEFASEAADVQQDIVIPGIDNANPEHVEKEDLLEVVDFDQEPKKRSSSRRRNSLDHAQEYGNMLNV